MSGPRLSQHLGLGASVYDKEQFVIFPIGEGVKQSGFAGLLAQLIGGAAHRDHLFAQSRPGSFGLEAGQVLCEPVANVHHGAHFRARREPLAFGETGREFPVPVGSASPELSGGEDPVACFRAMSGECALVAGFTDERHRGGKTGGLMRNVAADDGHPMSTGDIGQTSVEVSQPFDLHFFAHSQRDNGRARSTTHGGDVAEVAVKELRADPTRGNRVVEVFAVDDRINRHELVFERSGQDRTIVTNTRGSFGCRGSQPSLDFVDQLNLAEGSDRLGTLASKRRHDAEFEGAR